jgi:hypothetical protein
MSGQAESFIKAQEKVQGGMQPRLKFWMHGLIRGLLSGKEKARF